MDKEICICSAVVAEDGEIFRGQRHSDCIDAILKRGKVPRKRENMQGFMTSKNRFVNRQTGKILQEVAGIKSVSKEGYKGNILYSEDLY